MKSRFFLTALFLTAFPAFAQDETPEEVPTVTATSSPTPRPTPINTFSISQAEWTNKFGLGLSQITVRPRNFLSNQATFLTLFSVRYGLSDRFLLEALAGGTTGNQIGYDTNNNPTVSDPYWAYCYGFGVKTALVRPFEGFWVQTLTRVLYFENSVQNSQSGGFSGPGPILTDHYQYLSFSAGLGFEYFLPFVKNLSLEANENLEFDTNWESYTNNPRNGSASLTQNFSTWVFMVVSPGFNLTSLSIHYYF